MESKHGFRSSGLTLRAAARYKPPNFTDKVMSSGTWQAVGKADEIIDGKMTGRELGETHVVVCRHLGTLYALSGVCSHAFALLHEGRLRGHRIICPLHGASFDCRTGAVLGQPANTPLRTFPVRVNDDGVVEVDVYE